MESEEFTPFTLVGVLNILIGCLLGGYVGAAWVLHRNGHETIAVVAALALVLGIQLLVVDRLETIVATIRNTVANEQKPCEEPVDEDDLPVDETCVLIPTLNEAPTIGDVIDGFADRGFTDILVYDGGSTDGTREVARDHGARVVTGPGKGKGAAVRKAVAEDIEADYVVMLDGDGTYHPEEVDRLLTPLVDGPYDHVIGNRFANMEAGAMTRLNQFGNRLINAVFTIVYRQRYQDILSGYRAFTTESMAALDLSEDGFGIETEISVECAKRGVPTTVAPITYSARPPESQTNLRPFRDGAVILTALYRFGRTYNPVIYLTSAGVASIIGGVGIGGFVGYQWGLFGIVHDVLAVVAAFGILFGAQLVMFGLLANALIDVQQAYLEAHE